LSSRSVGSKGFQVSEVANKAKGVWASFYSLQKESFCGGVRDPDMFELEVRLVRQTFVEPDLGTRHVRC
jgi:hypothetical protein